MIIITKQLTNVWRLPRKREIRDDEEGASKTVECRAAFQYLLAAPPPPPSRTTPALLPSLLLHLMAIEREDVWRGKDSNERLE
jgi:hypothetical protein